jgi:hypothetical protein
MAACQFGIMINKISWLEGRIFFFEKKKQKTFIQ